MKTIVIIPMLFASFLTMAQSTTPASKELKIRFEKIQTAMTLADFKKAVPSAVLGENQEDFRAIMTEKIGKNGLKSIDYFFTQTQEKHLYEIIVAFDNADAQVKAIKSLFGKANYPGKDDQWLIYKGDADYTTIGWSFNAKFVLAASVPGSEWASDIRFKMLKDADDLDQRIHKTTLKKVINLTKDDYAKGLDMVMENVQLETPADTLVALLPDEGLDTSVINSDEMTHQPIKMLINNYGLHEALLFFKKTEQKPLYKIALDFENADTLKALILGGLGKPNHPKLDNHWVLSIGDKDKIGIYKIVVLWLMNDSLIFSINLPDTPMRDDDMFKLSEEFIANFIKEK